MLEELKKQYKQVYPLEDGTFMVSTKDPEEVNAIEYYAHTEIDEVYGMEGNWGLVAQDGSIIIKPQYIYPFIECGKHFQVMMPHEYKIIEGQKK